MFSRKRIYLIAAVLIGIYFFFVFYPNQDPSSSLQSRISDRFFVSLYLPFVRGLSGSSKAVKKFFRDYLFVVSVGRENLRLKEEIKVRDLHILSLKERLRSGTRHQTMFDLLASWGLEGIAARVAAYDPYASSQTVWVSAGRNQGVVLDSPVVTSEGLVGRVIRVLGKTSQILLMTDPHFSVDAVHETSRVRALVTGSGRGAYLERYPQLSHLEFLNLGYGMNQGDLFLTSGLGSVYPGGIPVGHVVFQNGKTSILPLVDFASLEEVVILKR